MCVNKCVFIFRSDQISMIFYCTPQKTITAWGFIFSSRSFKKRFYWTIYQDKWSVPRHPISSPHPLSFSCELEGVFRCNHMSFVLKCPISAKRSTAGCGCGGLKCHLCQSVMETSSCWATAWSDSRLPGDIRQTNSGGKNRLSPN